MNQKDDENAAYDYADSYKEPAPYYRNDLFHAYLAGIVYGREHPNQGSIFITQPIKLVPFKEDKE